MKIKVSEASGASLDWMVRYAQNGRTPIDYVPNRDNFSTCWNKGGPIIEREGLTVEYLHDSRWIARHPTAKRHSRPVCGEGHAPLIAAMRCYVVSKLGEEVEVPDELL